MNIEPSFNPEARSGAITSGPRVEGDVEFVSRSCRRVFSNPLEIIRADSLQEVGACLDRLDHINTEGLYVAGFLSYEAAPGLSSDLQTHSLHGFPLLWFGVYREPAVDVPEFTPCETKLELEEWFPLLSPAEYDVKLGRIRELLESGDTYQVNFTFPMRSKLIRDTHRLFGTLCAAQTADHAAYVNTGEAHILSLSPELFFARNGDKLVTRPMKGTRPRGLWPAADRQLAAELVASPKDQAENVMIVDLLRNDLGSISDFGSVRVTSLFMAEKYPTLWQMTSTVESRSSASLAETLQALFPCGSVTGAPKIRTMQIIRELEMVPRGIYCGTIGWSAPDGTAEFNVAIRTLVVDAATGNATYSVGSGITADSVSRHEYDECLAKAAILRRHCPRFDLLESLRYDGDYFLLDEHLDRLEASAQYFDFTFDRTSARIALIDRAEEFGRLLTPDTVVKVRLLASRDGRFLVTGNAIPNFPNEVEFRLATAQIDRNDVFLYHKTTHRAVYEQALAENPDVDDVLLWNDRGELTESTRANLVLRIGDERLTPPVESGLLAGTFRNHLVKSGKLTEAVLSQQDLDGADEIWLINSVRGWMRASR